MLRAARHGEAELQCEETPPHYASAHLRRAAGRSAGRETVGRLSGSDSDRSFCPGSVRRHLPISGLRVLRDATGAGERHHDQPPAGRAGRVYAPLTQEWGLTLHPARTPGHGALIAVRVMP